MPWSQTPVVSSIIAIAYFGLLPSAAFKASAFSRYAGLSIVHKCTFFASQYRACTLNSSSFGLPLPGLPVDFITDLVANLWSGGTFLTSTPEQALQRGRCHFYSPDHPLGNNITFHLSFDRIPTTRASLGTRMALFDLHS
jgi:hypothetical protein